MMPGAGINAPRAAARRSQSIQLAGFTVQTLCAPAPLRFLRYFQSVDVI